MRLGAAVLGALLLGGCSVAPEHSTLTDTDSANVVVRLPFGSAESPNRVAVVDRTGLLDSARILQPDRIGTSTTIVVTPLPNDETSLAVEWFGPICEPDASLTIVASQHLEIELDHGTRVEECGAAGAHYGVVLDFSSPIKLPIRAVELEADPTATS